MIFKITNQNNDKYLICCNFGKLLDIINNYNMSHLFILDSSNGDPYNLEEIDEIEKNYNEFVCRFKDDKHCVNNAV